MAHKRTLIYFNTSYGMTSREDEDNDKKVPIVTAFLDVFRAKQACMRSLHA